MHFRSFLILFTLLGLTTTIPLSSNRTLSTPTKVDVSYRLPHYVEPTDYIIDLGMASDFYQSETFIVIKAEIKLKVLEAVNSFSLHYDLKDNLNDQRMRMWDTESPQNFILFTKSLNTVNQQLTITLVGDDAILDKSKTYILCFWDLTGDLRNDMYGFYLSKYENEDGEIQYAAGTQFQTTHARKAFPCFDEPSFKAKFQLSIIYPKEYKATASNTEGELNLDPVPGKPELAKMQFKITPTMSSYLIAFVVSKFEFSLTSPMNYNNAILYPEGFASAAKYSLSITEPIIRAMEYKTGIKYASMGIPQLHQVAMPDFSAGAMENWGLAIYRERGLLWTPEDSSNFQKQYVCAIIAHEISHMWFGDYVTTDWWSEAWLNEGFATFFEAKAADMVEPLWNMMGQFVVDDVQTIMQSDAVFGSWPLTSDPEDISTPGQISNKFSGITYSKGGSVIRMMEHFLGELKFYSALNDYLKTHEWTNTLPINLWNAFKRQDLLTLPTNVEMMDVMKSWTEKPGFPVITVTRNGNNAVLSQARFLLTPNTDTTKWFVPITYATSNINQYFTNTAVQEWLLPTADLTIPDVFVNNNWIIVNIQETGYYRVDYDATLWNEIIAILQSDRFVSINEVNRAQIIDDVMNLARVQTNKYETALTVTKYLSKETDYLPWVAAFNAFSYLRKRVDSSDQTFILLENYLTRISKKLYESVKFEIAPNENHLDVLRTVLALKWACDLDVSECVTKSRTAFQEYKTNGVKVNPNLRGIVYCNALRENAQTDWNFLWDKFGQARMSTEKVTIISALGCTSNKDILNKYLTKSITATSGIKSQDALSVFTAVLNGNPSNIDVALDFLIDKFMEISNYYGGMRSLTRIIEGIADRITLTEQVTKFKNFINANRPQLQDAAEAADAAIANAEANIAWFNTYRPTVLKWLQQERNSGRTATMSLSLTAIIVSFVLFFAQ